MSSSRRQSPARSSDLLPRVMDAAPAPAGDALLLESGDYLLLENGDRLLLE